MSGEPDYEAAIGLIRHLPTEELKDLVNNDDKLSELMNDLPQAKQNLLSKYEEAAQLSEEVNTMKGEMDSSSGQYSADTLQALLQTAALESEEETENLVQSFLDKEKDVDEFLNLFLSKRKTAHLRRIKAEKIGDVMSQSNSSQSAPYPTNAGGFSAPQWASPYPSQPMNMPMPGYL